METQFRRFVRQHDLIPPGSSGIVSLSGGPDSLCLLSLIAGLAAEWRLSVLAVHVDHGLRRESPGEAAAASRLAGQLGVPCAVRHAGGLSEARGNLQQAAREARVQLLSEEAERREAHWIALGHTADDQAETVLLRLIRGAGPRGLAAMSVRSGRFVRPLLWARRGAITRQLGRAGLRPVQDPTNATDRYQRNRVRHELLPLLERENASIVETLGRLADNCSEESMALDQLADGMLTKALDGSDLDLNRLRHLPPGLIRRVFARYYDSVRGSLRRLQRGHLLALSAVAMRRHGSEQLDLPGVRASRHYDTLRLELAGGRGQSARRAAPSPPVLTVAGPGSWPLPAGGQLTVTEGQAGTQHRDELPLERLQLPLAVRGPRAGDRIAVGPNQQRKVARVLIDAKVPRFARSSVCVVVSEARVVLIVGLRRAWGLAPAAGDPVLHFSLGDQTQ